MNFVNNFLTSKIRHFFPETFLPTSVSGIFVSVLFANDYITVKSRDVFLSVNSSKAEVAEIVDFPDSQKQFFPRLLLPLRLNSAAFDLQNLVEGYGRLATINHNPERARLPKTAPFVVFPDNRNCVYNSLPHAVLEAFQQKLKRQFIVNDWHFSVEFCCHGRLRSQNIHLGKIFLNFLNHLNAFFQITGWIISIYVSIPFFIFQKYLFLLIFLRWLKMLKLKFWWFFWQSEDGFFKTTCYVFFIETSVSVSSLCIHETFIDGSDNHFVILSLASFHKPFFKSHVCLMFRPSSLKPTTNFLSWIVQLQEN